MYHNIFESKINKLRALIFEKLVPLIDNDYILVDLPYHSNIGDILIWEGECCFLNSLPFKCIYSASMHTYKKQKLTNDTIILIHGGGNWGDVWRPSQDFHLKIIQEYPDNKIIVFPQTVHYDNQQNLEYDISIISRHKNLTICTRDNVSFELLKKTYLNTKVLLVPDMAFCISTHSLLKYKMKSSDIDLYLKRGDKEEVYFNINNYTNNFKVLDWPSMESKSFTALLLRGISIAQRLKIFPTFWVDYYAQNVARIKMIEVGVKFLSKYNTIYTTRLHGAILSVLMGKSFFLINNSYGKNKNYFQTWFYDLSDQCFFLDVDKD